MDRQQIAGRFRLPTEALLWTGGLLALYLLDPGSSGRIDLCLFHRLGLGFCPGCGLGGSIHHILHGDLVASWKLHPLGIPAVLIVGARVAGLWRRSITAVLCENRA